MNDLYRKMMSSYKLTTDRDVRTARYKAGQEIILSGLYHGGFFDTAAFCGGSCLRVFHGLERFSEDMDFCLMESDDGFDFSKFVKHIMDEFALVGREVEVKEKACRGRQAVGTMDGMIVYEVLSLYDKPQKIRVEINTKPAVRFETELRLAIQPRSYLVRCMALPDLFASKTHALLHRTWGGRAKGRDWYDFEWFVKNNVPLHYEHLSEKVESESGELLTKEGIKEMLNERIGKTSIEQVRQDLAPFVNAESGAGLWSAAYFRELVKCIRWV